MSSFRSSVSYTKMNASSSRGATLAELREKAELKKAIIAEAAARLNEEKSALEVGGSHQDTRDCSKTRRHHAALR